VPAPTTYGKGDPSWGFAMASIGSGWPVPLNDWRGMHPAKTRGGKSPYWRRSALNEARGMYQSVAG
jgi:hypothetical protein